MGTWTDWGSIAIEHRFMAGVYYSTDEIAQVARCSAEHVRRACRNGALQASQDRVRGHWVALGEDCFDWARRGRPSGQ